MGVQQIYYLSMQSEQSYRGSDNSNNEQNLIKRVRKMPTANVLTFDEFVKNTIKQFNAKNNVYNPESASSANLEELFIPKKFRANRSQKQLVLSPLMLRRRQGSVKSLGGYSVIANNGVLESSRVSLTRNKSGELVVNQYVIREDVLGRGAFAQVRLCQNLQTNKLYAVKILDEHRYRRARWSKSEMDVVHFMNKEVAIAKKLNHPNIVKLYEVIEDEEYKKFYMIMEHCQKGSLKNEMMARRQKIGMNEKEIKAIFKGLLLALDYLHNTVGIAHCDIKPENILLSSDGVAKLSDFGLSKDQYLQQTPSASGTLMYMAPQVVNGEKTRDIKARDIWSLGITLFEVVTGRLPYPNAQTAVNLQKTINTHIFNFELEIMSESLKMFLHLCLQKNPNQRASVYLLMKTKWITEGEGQLRQLPEYTKKSISITPQEQMASIIKKRKPNNTPF